MRAERREKLLSYRTRYEKAGGHMDADLRKRRGMCMLTEQND
jgi:hypothetical protein